MRGRGGRGDAAEQIKAVEYFRDERGRIAALGLLSLFSAQFQAAALILVALLAKTIASGHHHYEGHLGPFDLSLGTATLSALTAGAILAAAVLDTWIAWWMSKIMARWELDKREELIAAYLHSDYATQAAERLGTLSTLLGYAVRGSTALGTIINALEAAITILIFVLGAILVDASASVVLIVMIAVLTVALRPIISRTKRYSKLLSAMSVDYGRDVTETTRMARDVRVFWAVDAVGRQMRNVARRVAHVRQRAAFVRSMTSPAYQYLGMLLIVGALASAQGLNSLDVAKFGAIALLLLRSMTYGQQLQSAYQNFAESMPYVHQLEEMRSNYLAHATRDGTVALEAIHRLDLVGVSYTYDGSEEALTDVTASFPVGEIVGVVGASGSGKSTLSQLILRLRDPTRGFILVNRVPVGEYTFASWYRHVSLVPQDVHLLHATVADNIAFLDDSVSPEQVVAAAKAANIHEVIEGLAHGYDTLIGPAFRDLSGGQIQRIGIARALARGAQVLVLDEPTSALDVHSESVIQSTLESLRGRALVLIIAHRLSTLSICDRIVVLSRGQIETMGSLPYVSEHSPFFRRALDTGTLDVGAIDPSRGVAFEVDES
jgi:ABC-type multidrug transport system fused ATPase/permease subunit